MKGVDDAFLGVGDKPGLDIWCIVGSSLVPLAKSQHGKFYARNCYIILNTTELKTGVRRHDVHYWVGEEAKEEDCLLASDKAVELDAVLGSNTVQYRETQGEESDKFLSYFRPCIIPVHSHPPSHMEGSRSKSSQTTMFRCEGEHVARVTEVAFSRSSLDHKGVFIVDTASKIFIFSGCNSSVQTRAKALDVVRHLKENRHSGRCEIAAIEDGKLVGDSDAGEFWNLFGGYAPIPRDLPEAVREESMNMPAEKLFWINKRILVPMEAHLLDREILNSDRSYILDCGTEIFLWMGMTTLVSERKTSVTALEDYVHSQGRSSNVRAVIMTEGHETVDFKLHFQHWPKIVEMKLYDAGREKVAAIFKHQGYDVTEIPEDRPQQLISCNGTLKVWLVDCGCTTLLSTEEQEKLYTGDCYIVQYSYVEDGKEYHLFLAWYGKNSVKEDSVATASLMSSLANSVKGHPVVAQVFDSREPELFFSIFKSLIIFKGGRSAAYKNHVVQKSDRNGCPQKDEVALFRVQALRHDCVQTIQVDLVASSLNSSHCYILQDGGSFFTWLGSLSSPSDHNMLDRMMNKLCPFKQSLLVREGSEPDDFWKALCGRSEYSKEKRVKGWPADPHLYSCRFEQGLLKVKEVFSFCQDDLATEETLVLDCNSEIYVWVGLHSDVTSKEQALNIGKMFLQDGILHDRRSIETTVYIITEGDEPAFFTDFFKWDSSKQSSMVGNSFERKLALLKGLSPKLETPDRSMRRPSPRRLGVSSEPTTPEHQQQQPMAARRAFGSASAGRFARERSPAAALTASPPTPSPKSRSSSSTSTPTAVARRLFPASLHASQAVHVLSNGTARRR
ncbi:villin-1-like isoform X2 [Panicum hallii]|uniref:villin-1-like isoform X1 n=2 Tax=Panicum hallii TaxID=206008 RepID=UPI000DF4EC3D|nr:villin-1-like isoform X1 [Panicum hallii]XP_025807992.1 villin-1-like isoform X2 [Panicum hallii]